MEDVEYLRVEAARCRRLAAGTAGTPVARLPEMSDGYDRKADELRCVLNKSGGEREVGA
jgi:hypothetical protein